jgi:hypothetical protein
MTYFYPLGNLSPWQNNELRYSLRSFNPEQVVVIGEKPTWYTGEHYPFPTGLWSKPKDIFLKTREMCKYAEEFIFCNDDHFLLSPIESLPNYFSGPLRNFKRGSQTFQRYVENTRKRFPDGLYYDIHTPLRIESAKFLQLSYREDVVMKSLYCNTFPGESVQMDDLKIDHHVRTEDIERLIQGRQFLSVGDNGLSRDMKEWLAKRFPTPSRWELV